MMKRSNLLILTSVLGVSGFFLGASLFRGEYVTHDAFHRNQQESAQYLDSVTYNYQTIRWDELFDEVVIQDTSGLKRNNNNELLIQWVKSDRVGAKKKDYSHFGKDMYIRDNRLVIDCSSANQYSTGVLRIYSPSLNRVTLRNVSNVKLVDTWVEKLSIVADSAKFYIDRSTRVEALDVHAIRSEVAVQTDTLFDANYVLNDGSIMKNQVDSCSNISVSGDPTATVWLSPFFESDSGLPPSGVYGNVRFTEMSGKIIIENSEIDHIYGNKDQLTLHMGVPQIRETLANVVDE